MRNNNQRQEKTAPVHSASKSGYNFVMRQGWMDNPQNNPPAPLAFDPVWRHQPIDDQSVIITNGKYFSDALDRANINLAHGYDHWGSVGECLTDAFRAVYGPNGTKTPVTRLPECQTAFIAVAKAHINQWLDNVGKHSVENRQLYRGMIQNLTWVRAGDLQP